MAASSGVNAAIVSLNNTVMIDGTTIWTQDLSSLTSPTANGSAIENLDGSSTYMGTDGSTIWDYSWNITAKADPFVAGTFTVTNTSAITQTFDITFELPISPSFTDGFMTGSLAGRFSDFDNSGSATLSLNTWQGLIDGIPKLDIFLLTSTCTGPGCSFIIAEIIEGPTAFTGDVTNTIGIHMNFALSAGDQASFDTSFEVNPIPVPAAAWLFGTGLLALVGVARRKTQ